MNLRNVAPVVSVSTSSTDGIPTPLNVLDISDTTHFLTISNQVLFYS